MLTIKVGLYLAVRQIKRASKWTTLLIIGVMLLTFLNLVVVSGILTGLITGSFKQYKESYSGDVIITSATGRDYIENSPALLDFLRNHPGVKNISPRYRVGAQVLGTLNDNPKKFERPNRVGSQISGIDVNAEEDVTKFSRFLLKGENLQANEEGYLLIGANLLRKYSSFADANIPGLELLSNVDVGSRVRITFSSEEEPVSKEFIVKGIVKSKVDEISVRMFITDRELKRIIPANKEQVQEIAIKIQDIEPAVLTAQIKEFMGTTHAARIQTSEEAIPSFLRDIEETMAILGNAISSIGLAVAAITVFIVIFINAITRRKFIGILKGIGISGSAIEISYIFQALFYATAGSIIGVALVYGFLIPYFDQNPIDFPFSDGILVASYEGTAVRLAILYVVTVLAGYLPAKLVVSKNTLDAILGR
jgi:putative ABC transport system permease protein